MITDHKKHGVLPFCPFCKRLTETGRPVDGHVKYFGDYIHFFVFKGTLYYSRMAECITCRRTYVSFATYGGYLKGEALFWPFPRVFPNQ